MGWIAGAIGIGLATLAAYGAALGALAALALALALPLVLRAYPLIPGMLTGVARGVLVGAGVALAAVSAWHFSALSHDRTNELRRLQTVIAEQARQREAAEAIAARAREAAADRVRIAETLQEQVNEFERAIAAGEVAPCPDDPGYRRRMRRIHIGGAAKPATPGN